jgi:flagellin
MATNTQFNGVSLLQGGKTLSFQVGAGANHAAGTDADGNAIAADSSNTISINTVDLTGDLQGLVGADNGDGTTAPATSPFSVADNGAANATIANIDKAITAISTDQSKIGATENRFADAVQTLAVTSQNLSAANSRIQDTDMASEMVEYSQKSVLQQAGVSMLAQANASSQGILKLLG